MAGNPNERLLRFSRAPIENEEPENDSSCDLHKARQLVYQFLATRWCGLAAKKKAKCGFREIPQKGSKKKVNHYASAFSTNRVNRQIPCSLKRDLVEVSCDWHDNATRFPMIRDSLFARETVNSPLQSLCGVCSALCQHSKKHLSSACELVNMLTVIRTTVQLLLSLD